MGVNALYRANVISTESSSTSGCGILNCVNALYRANVISTPLLQNPVFMRVSGTVFARIFLNCQILGYNKAKKWAGYKLYFFRYNFDIFYTIIIHQFIRQTTSQIQILYAEIIAFKTLFSAFIKGQQQLQPLLNTRYTPFLSVIIIMLLVIPTVGWTNSDTYDICFSGLRDGGVFIISTLGTNNIVSYREFIPGYNEMRKRFPNTQIICVGDVLYGENLTDM